MLLLRTQLLRSSSLRILRPSTAKSFDAVSYFACTACIPRNLCGKAGLEYAPGSRDGANTKININKQLVLRGKAASVFQDQIINNFLRDHNVATCEEWQRLVDEVLNLHYGMCSEINIDGKIVENCSHLKKLDLARSYLTFMKWKKRKFNGAVVSAFIRTCYKARASMTDHDAERIVHFTQYLQEKYKVVDPLICDSIIKGLALQGKTDEVLALLRQAQEVCTPLKSTYSAVAMCLLEANAVDEAKSIIQESVHLTEHEAVSDDVYIKWVDMFRNDRAKLDELLYTLRMFDIKLRRLVCDHLLSVYQDLPVANRLIGTYGTISSSGKCSQCEQNLTTAELDRDDFAQLQHLFLNNVLVNGDVFKHTTPTELKKFFNVVHTDDPCDIVIDGLNVAYMLGTTVPTSVFVKLLESVIQHFKERDMNCFVIGRNHMRNWPNLYDVFKKTGTKHFFIDDISEDDPFMLYLAMYKGNKTMIVTRDLFRSEKYRLKSDKEVTLFKRWQQSHQIFITFVSPAGKVYTRSPLTFEMMVQTSEAGGWHIPYIDDEGTRTDEYGIHRKWLCLKPPSS